MRRVLLIPVVLTAAFLLSGMSLDNHRDNTGRILVVPQPKKYLPGEGTFRLPKKLKVSLPPESGIIPEIMNSQISAVFPGFSIETVKSSDAVCRLYLKNSADDAFFANPEAYKLMITPGGIEISAGDVRGLFYGVQTLNALIRNAGTPELAACTIEDYPDLSMRGLFLSLRLLDSARIPAFKKLVDTLASLKYNNLILEFADNFPYQDNPFTLRQSTLTRDELEDLVGFIRDRHFKIIPQIQLLSHVRWLSTHPNFSAFLEGRPNKLWNSAYCPSNPEVTSLVFRVIREQMEFFHPEVFDLCYDEVTICPFRKCPECRKHRPEELLYQHLKDAGDIVLEMGASPNVYHDTFLPGKPERGELVIDRLNRRFTIGYWGYGKRPADHFRDFASRGFTVLGMPLCGEPDSIQAMARYAVQYNSPGCNSAFWHHLVGVLEDPGQSAVEGFGGIVLGGEYYWNTGTLRELLSYDPVVELRRRLYDVPSGSKCHTAEKSLRAVPVPLQKKFNAEFGASNDFPCFQSPDKLDQLKRDISAAPERFALVTSKNRYYGIMLAGDENDSLPKAPVTIPINRKVRRFSFLLTASRPNNTSHFVPYGKYHVTRKLKVGEVRLRYTDGDVRQIPLLYRYNINDWCSEFGGIAMRHVNRSTDDRNVIFNFGATDIENPRPEDTVESMELDTMCIEGISPVLLALSVWQEEPISAPVMEKAADPHEIDSDGIIVSGRGDNEINDFPVFDSTAQNTETPRVEWITNTGRRTLRTLFAQDENGEPVLRIVVPPAPPATLETSNRVLAKFPLTAIPHQAKSLYFNFRIDKPILRYCGAYLVGEGSETASDLPHMAFFFHDLPANDSWFNLTTGFNTLRNFHGMKNPFDARNIWLSFWLYKNEEVVNIDLRKVGFSNAPGRYAAPPRISTELR